MIRIALINPNTDTHATARMLASARAFAATLLPPAGQPAHSFDIEGFTATRGAALITTPADLIAAEQGAVDLGGTVAAQGFDALVIAGFGEPGLEVLRETVPIPVVGIAEAGIGEAGEGGRRYSIVTITPSLAESLRASARRYGHDANLASIRFTPGDPKALVTDGLALQAALLHAIRVAIDTDRAEAILIGGGPLAAAANAIRDRIDAPLIEPVAAAMALALRRISESR